MPDSRWIERELTRQLGAVTAPETLWDRLQEQPAARRRRSFEWALWPVAAALIVIVAGGAAWQLTRAQDSSLGMEALASAELNAREFDVRSDDPAAIRAWVKDRTNISLDLRGGNGAVRLLGTRILERAGAPVVAISYRVGDARAALLVSRTSSSDGTGHQFARIGPFSWRMHGQVYTLACSAKDPQIACLLCHANSAVN